MAYDEGLARRVRERLGARSGVTEKRAAEELAFLRNGNMAIGVRAEGLLVRVGPREADLALARPGVSQFENGGRVLKGWVLVDASVLVDEVALNDWVDTAHAFVVSLPPK